MTHVAFAGRKEEVGFEAVLAVVEIAVAAVEDVECLVGSALDDVPLLDDQDLVGAADGGEAVRDDEGRPALHEEVEAGLDQGFGLGVERAGGFVEDEDAGVGEDGAGDGETLALAAGELDAALADDGVVAASGKRSANSSTRAILAGFEEVFFGGGGARRISRSRGWCRRRGMSPAARRRAAGGSWRAGRRRGRWPSMSTAPDCAVWNPQMSEMMVDLPEPLEPTSAVTVPGATRS